MLSNFNWVDYVILGIFFLSILAGISRGLVKELISLITLAVAVVVATLFATTLAASMTSSPSVQGAVSDAANSISISTGTITQTVSYAAVGLSFALIFAATILVGAIIGFFINMALSVGVLGIGNRLFGGLFGLGRGFIFNLVIIFVLQLTAVANQTWWQQSYCVQQYQPAVSWLGTMVSPELDKLKDRITATMQNVTPSDSSASGSSDSSN